MNKAWRLAALASTGADVSLSAKELRLRDVMEVILAAFPGSTVTIKDADAIPVERMHLITAVAARIGVDLEAERSDHIELSGDSTSR